MSEVTVLGLGLMGSALARAVLKAGYKTTVWNRTQEKMEPFIAQGAGGASSVTSAVDASPVVLICVDNYSVTKDLLDNEAVASVMPGKVLAQLSTGSPTIAEEAATWFNSLDVHYIDGEILALPEGIGADDTQILFAGHELSFRQYEPIFQCLGGDLRFLSENVRAPSALNLGWLCQRFGMLLGALHGINLCASENVGADSYASLFAESDRVYTLARTIHTDDYENPSVTVQVWRDVIERIQKQANTVGIDNSFPELAAAFLRKGIKAGYAAEDLSALFKVL